MEIDLEALEVLFERASVRSDIPALEHLELSLHVSPYDREELRITVQDVRYNTILTIGIPVKTRTTIRFNE